MKFSQAAAASLHLIGATLAGGTIPAAAETDRVDWQSAVPALAKYRREVVADDLWKRPDLSPRDRSVVTIAGLIARNQTVELQRYIELALDNGVKPAELSEIITHLNFYAGSGNATSAAAVAATVFKARGIPSLDGPSTDAPLPLNEATEAERANRNQEQFGAVAPGLLKFTTEVLFRDLWLRPGLSPRDRSMITVSALIANGQVAQIPYHLNRAMDNGLKPAEAGEMLAQLAFYVGWPNAFSALPVVKDVISKRGK